MSIKFKFLAIALIVLSFVGCAKSSTPVVKIPAKSEPPKFNAAKPEESKKLTPPFTIAARDGWSLVNYVPLKPDDKEPQLIAIFENDLDDEVSVRAGILAGNLPDDEVDSYLDDIRELAHSRDNVKILKERIFKLGTLRAYEFVEARATSSGPQIFVTLAVTADKVGYMIGCGGGLSVAERVLPVCAEFVEGFRVVGK